ncbi:MAG: ATP-binding cassette domain-containing protein [Alphaproteobacteria bacterium]|nr:ATP-binding cassette domain-containing protein [Alphaproteobacteria bacterium]
MIELEQVSVRFHDRTILDNISVSLTEHRIGVVGDNGSGKSTFARLLNGLLLPDLGTVEVNNLDTRDDGKDVRSQVGFLFQNPDNQIVMPTVAEDLALGLKPHKLTGAEQSHRVSVTLDRFSLTHLADRSAHLLSGGEKQLVALAGVMVTQPQILVCDEPTTLLDRRNAAHVMRLIGELPCQVIVITHHVEHLNDFDRVLVIADGRISDDGPPGETIPRYLETLA